MLQVYHSNRLELLFEILCAQRDEHRLQDPFQAEQILVANPGIGRWLSLQLSERKGIAANIDYPLPASFIWKLYCAHLPQVPEHSAFNKPRLQWTLMQLLSALPADDIHEPLLRYLQAEDENQRTLKKVQLAAKIADVFDQYLVYRPDWLLEWERGKHPQTAPGNWQAAVWCALRERLDEPHRASLHAAFCSAAAAGKLDKSKLPERLYIFNVVSIPPSYLDVLTALAEHIPVDLYLLNPSVEYWDEITDRKKQLKLRQKQGVDTPLDDGNPLLAATGRLGQNALRLLHERGNFIHEQNFSLPPEQGGRLAQLQREVLTLTQPQSEPSSNTVAQLGLCLEGADHSLEVHSTHSVLREVQVLHDQLLARFERLPGLGPADIVVMVPNVDQYTPAVAAVFGSAPSERYIPWEIADRSLSQTDPVVSLMRTLLDLPQSHFKASEVLGWLAQPVLARRFDLLEAESQQLLIQWVQDSGARRELGCAPLSADDSSPLNSWAFALRRLLAGYAMVGEGQPVAGVYPSLTLEGSAAVLLGRLIDCMDRLAYWRVELQEERTMSAWLDTFNRLVADLLDPDDDEAFGIQQLRECLLALAENATLSSYDEPLAPSAMLALLDNALAGNSGKTQRFLTGRVTISSMVPLRSVPFRVVCLLGLNDGEFPRQNRPVSFDLIQNDARIGDRSVREDDHYLFLEALLSARDELYLSWIGRGSADNKEQAPSILLAELMRYFRHDDKGDNGSGSLVFLQHPLQAFSPRYFNAEKEELYSYAAQWLPGDAQTREKFTPQKPSAGALSLSALLKFWRDPVGYYCREVLHLGLYSSSKLAADVEPFSLDNLQAYQLKVSLLEGALATPVVPAELALAQAMGRGELPHGSFAALVFDKNLQLIEELSPRVVAISQEPLAPVAFELSVQGWQLSGQLDSLYSKGGKPLLLMARPGDFNGKDLLKLSLSHLVGCAAGVLQSDSVFVSKKMHHKMPHVKPAEALQMLEPWLEYFAQGQTEPLHFFPNSSWAYAAEQFKDGDKISKVGGIWQGGSYSRGEAESEAVRLLWPDIQTPLELPRFTALAEALLTPVVELLSEDKP